MKRLLFIIAALVIAAVGSNFYYAKQAQKHLDSMATAVRAVGGNLEYDDVRISLAGSVEIDNVRFTAPEWQDSLTIKRVALETGGIFGVHMLAMDVRKKRMPAELGLSFEGFRLPLGGEIYKQTNMMASEHSEYLLLAGCGDHTEIQDQSLIKMGYGDFVDVDVQGKYRLMNEGQWFELESRTLMEGMSDTSLKLDFSLNAKSREVSELGKTMLNTKLNELVIDYQDKGYIKKLLDFCQQESGLSKEDFLNQHMEAWKQAWAQLGYAVGENVITAYRQFIEQPDQLRISAKPLDDFGLMKLSAISPELLPYQFLTDLQVNGVAAGRLELTVLQETSANIINTSLIPNNTPRRQTTYITVEEQALRSHLNQEVILRLKSGRKLEGRIREVSADRLQLHSYQPSGFMMIPVTFTQIDEAQLK